MNINDLTLNTPVYNFYYGKGKILKIDNDYIKVIFYCKFFKGNKFILDFTKDENFYYEKNKRHITELSLKEY